MKPIVKIIGLLFITIMLFSCGNSNNEKNQSTSDGINLDAVINSNAKDKDSKGENKCLLAYQEKLNDLLTEDDVIRETGFDKQKMSVDYRKNLKDPKYHEYVYRFKNGRKSVIGSFNQEYEISDVVIVREIEAMTLNRFQNSYRAATEEELQAARDALKDVTDGKSDNPDAKDLMHEAEKKNLSKEQINETGGTLTNAFAEITKAYVQLNDLGDAAVWNTKTGELNVLQNGVKFTILSDISANNDTNKQVAVNLAKIILDKCK